MPFIVSEGKRVFVPSKKIRNWDISLDIDVPIKEPDTKSLVDKTIIPSDNNYSLQLISIENNDNKSNIRLDQRQEPILEPIIQNNQQVHKITINNINDSNYNNDAYKNFQSQPDGKSDSKSIGKAYGKAIGKVDSKANSIVDSKSNGKGLGDFTMGFTIDSKSNGKANGKSNGIADGKVDGKVDGNVVGKADNVIIDRSDYELISDIKHEPPEYKKVLTRVMLLICQTPTCFSNKIKQSVDIADKLGISKQNLLDKHKYLIYKKHYYSISFSKGGNNGYTIFTCSEQMKNIWINNFLNIDGKAIGNVYGNANFLFDGKVDGNAKREEEVIFNNIKNSSSNISEYLIINRDDFEWLDENRIKQIINFGNCSPNDLQDVLDKIRFAKESGEWEKSWKVQNEPAFVMNAIKETGTIYIPKDYISPKIRLQREKIERLRAEAEEIKKLEEEAKELEYYIWKSNLTKEDLDEIYINEEFNRFKDKINLESKIQDSLLRDYYFNNIYTKSE